MTARRRQKTSWPVRLALVAAISWSPVVQSADDALRESAERILAEEGLTGIAWTLVEGAGEVRIGTAGLRDNRAGEAFTPATRFHVGSVTKSLLATGVLRLATEGRIDLDAPARLYLPGLPFDNPWAERSEVSVRHLLDHTSGLADAHLWHIFSERADPDAPLTEAFPDPSLQLQIRSRPGTRFSYSNMGYTLLGLIIEAVVGEPYENYLDEFMLGPLGMHDSTFAFTTQDGAAADPTLAWGHVDGGEPFAARPMFLRPAGQFTTTAADLARFAEFLMGDGTIDGEVFIDETLMRSRGRPIGTEAADAGLDAGYALGLGRRDRHGVVGYCHAGNVLGFVAMLCVFPGEHKAFAYSINTDSETADYGRFESLFVRALAIGEAAPPPTVAPPPGMSRWHGHYILSPNRFEMFEYLDNVFGAIKVSADGDSLALAAMQQDTRSLRSNGDRHYSASDRATTSHVLLQGESGEYLISDGFKTFEKVPTAYLAAHWASLAAGLVGLLWILIAGCVSLLRYRSRLLRRPEAPALVAVALLVVPIPFFATQSFMALGDFTMASALLATVTGLLPLGMLLTVVRSLKRRGEPRLVLLHGIAAALVLQWCVVLIAAGMLPFRLWA